MITLKARPSDGGLTAKDFASGQQAKWCPGCGDHSVWVQVRKVLADRGARPESTVFVSGIGCSSRFPYYMNTYGYHTLHGRAPTVATGLKLARPELDIWIVTGDGDALSIGGNHLLHIIRRNLDVNILLLNNRIYGLTKGQYSPTTEVGTRTKSSPAGSVEQPVRPLSVVLGAGATFAARTVDMDVKHLQSVLAAAADHRGTSFVEIYQSCPTFNRDGFDYVADKESRSENLLYLEAGQPMIFGKDGDRAIGMVNGSPQVVKVADSRPDQILIHDPKTPTPSLAFMLSQIAQPIFPEPVGVLRQVERPIFDHEVHEQIRRVQQQKGKIDIREVLTGSEPWQVA